MLVLCSTKILIKPCTAIFPAADKVQLLMSAMPSHVRTGGPTHW